MALKAFSTHTALGLGLGMLNSTNNNPVMQTSIVQGSDAYAWKMTEVAGSEGYYLRLGGRGADGAVVGLNLNLIKFHFWYRPTSVGSDCQILALSNTLSDVSNAGRVGALRIRSDRILRMHDANDDNTTTATATGTAALQDQWYRICCSFNRSTKAYEILVYTEDGTLVDTISGTAASFGASAFACVFFSAFQGPWSDVDPEPTITAYYGSILLDDTAYPDAKARIGMLVANAAGTHTGFTLAAGASKVAAVSEIPPDGNTSYIVSTTANEACTFAMETCANKGISGTIIGFAPEIVEWTTAGGSCSTRLIENGTTTDCTAQAPGGFVNFHIRGVIYLAMPSDASTPTIAKLNAIEVGAVRDNTTAEMRIGTVCCHVIYVPTQPTSSNDAFLLDLI